MDFVGQRLTDRLHQLITAIFGVIGFFYGYVHQRFAFTMYISMIGLGISALLCVPDWPFLNQNPLKWQEAMGDNQEDEDEDVDEPVVQKEKRSGSKPKSKGKNKSNNKSGIRQRRR
ncbi:hypothetical protein AAMO2058_000368300 [Amorphochlora amoebiformis]